MKIAVIGGGASGLVSAYLLDKQGHHVSVFERQPMLGGHIRTLNKNVKPDRWRSLSVRGASQREGQSDCTRISDCIYRFYRVDEGIRCRTRTCECWFGDVF
jgi:glycine/D-amino acid oxidase-like deaminating enzyme